jgi:hypothetical protein
MPRTGFATVACSKPMRAGECRPCRCRKPSFITLSPGLRLRVQQPVPCWGTAFRSAAYGHGVESELNRSKPGVRNHSPTCGWRLSSELMKVSLWSEPRPHVICGAANRS